MKQVILIRTDVKMGKGKACAQVAHASLEAYKNALVRHMDKVQVWEYEGSKKVVVKVDSEKEMLEVYKKAKEAGVAASLIRDAGHTQLEPGTLTTVGLGPDDDKIIEALTRHLKLY